jgi:transglutaminase-like putative cysteine protease
MAVVGMTPDDSTPGLGLARLRIAVTAIGFIAVGIAAGGVFDRVHWSLAIAPAITATAAIALVGRPPWTRFVGAVVAVLLAVTLAVAVAGGSPSDLGRAVSSGVQGLLSTDWPSPSRADLIGTVAAGLATLSAIGAELAGRRRFHLAPLLALSTAYVAVLALSAPIGVRWVWLAVVVAAAVTLALLRNSGTVHDRWVLLRGERRLLPLGLTAVVLVVLALFPIAFDVRADPRRNDPAEQTAPLLDPVEATRALRDLDPPRDLHDVRVEGGGAVPVRWRTAALSDYDGRNWAPDLTLRPIGSTLGPATGPTISADIEFLDDNLTLVPMPGTPVTVDVPVETDADRTVVRLAERVSPGDSVGIVANTPPERSSALGIAPRLVDESTAGLTELATGLAGSGDAAEQLRRLETTMRDDFVLDNDVQGGGLERALVERFVRDTQRGTSEQFATAFVLLARSLGIESRVATGFVAGGAADDTTTVAAGDRLVLTSADADVWPEVQLADGTWLAYDPVPTEEAAGDAPTPPEPQVQSPAAPQPPVAPPPESDNEPATPDDETTTDDTDAWSTALMWVARGTIALAVVISPFLLAAVVILGVKYRRRRRRLGSPAASDRIRGAWASATDALVDAGLAISRSDTDGEIATGGASLARASSPELRRLASMSSAATFGTPRHVDLLAQEARSCLDAIEHGVTSDRTRWQRVRWRLSLRSLRPATRSPVTG